MTIREAEFMKRFEKKPPVKGGNQKRAVATINDTPPKGVKMDKEQKTSLIQKLKNKMRSVAFREVMRKEMTPFAVERYGCSVQELARLMLTVEDEYNIISCISDLIESLGIHYEDFMRALKELANEDTPKD